MENTELFNKKIKAVPQSKPEIGIDLDDNFAQSLVSASDKGLLDFGRLNEFTAVSSSRDMLYSQMDSMAQDPIIKAALDIYTEDIAQRNEIGNIIWVESSDEYTRKMVNYLLDSFRINKHISKWAQSLVLYGDLYVRLYRKSDFDMENSIFDNAPTEEEEDRTLNESTNLYLYSKGDDYINYVEMESNPAEMYELTNFGKTQGYIKAPVTSPIPLGDASVYNTVITSEYTYKYNQSEISVYQPTEYVHACLNETNNRYPEKVDIFNIVDDDPDNKQTVASYSVKRGTPMFQSAFKVWRSLRLLEDSLLLNRLTKSSIVRLIKVNVGDMPKEQVRTYMQRVKQMVEQKTSLNDGNTMGEYNNPGPIENNVYVPVHGDIGNIDSSTIGGEGEDVKSIIDLDYFKDKLYAALGIPKQFLNDTEDNTGFNGGTSLSLISSRYAKRIQKLQDALSEMVTDIVNIILISRGMQSSVNKFKIRMQAPSTQEEKDRKEGISTCINNTREVLDILADIDDPVKRFSMIKSMLGSGYINEDVLAIIQDTIDEAKEDKKLNGDEGMGEDDLGGDLGGDFGGDLGGLDTPPDLGGGEEPAESDTELPSMSDIGKDFTDSTQEF